MRLGEFRLQLLNSNFTHGLPIVRFASSKVTVSRPIEALGQAPLKGPAMIANTAHVQLWLIESITKSAN